MLLQRLATGATGVKQARYRRGPTRGSKALYAHAQYITRSFVQCMVCRGFCTLVLSFETVTCGEKKRKMTSTSQSTLQTSRSHSEVCLYLGFLCCDMLQIVMGLFIGFSYCVTVQTWQ